MITFHRVLISTAIVFCLGFAVWSGVTYGTDGGIVGRLLTVGFTAAALMLTVYLRYLDRFLGK